MALKYKVDTRREGAISVTAIGRNGKKPVTSTRTFPSEDVTVETLKNVVLLTSQDTYNKLARIQDRARLLGGDEK